MSPVADQEVMGMCHEWWMRRRFHEAEEASGLWDDFERTRPADEPDVTVEEPEITLEQREATPAAAER
jgi:hypothetical protein